VRTLREADVDCWRDQTANTRVTHQALLALSAQVEVVPEALSRSDPA
jgi:hypothetical protein